MNIEDYLWNVNADVLGRLCTMAKVGSNGRKEEKVKKLAVFYNRSDWAQEVFDSLTRYEKEMMTLFVQTGFHPTNDEKREIVEKYNVKLSYDNSLFNRNSKIELFYLGGKFIPLFVKEKLNEIVKPLEVKIDKTTDEIDFGEYLVIENRDKRVSDFDEFIKYINVGNVKATKAKGQLPKSALLKLHAKLEYPEIYMDDDKDIRSIEDTVVSMGIMNLLVNFGIIKIKKENFIIDEATCSEYQKANKLDKIRMIFNGYLSDDNNTINEIDRIESNHFRLENKNPFLGGARKILVEYLKKCPIDEWIDIGELYKWLRIKEYEFLRPYTGEVLEKDEYYNSYYYEASNNSLEFAYVDVFLMEYMAVMGIVDVLISRCYTDYMDRTYLKVDYFKITPFGANVLGIVNDLSVTNEDDSRFMVNEKFEIIINDNSRLQYELYFDRFLTKESDNPLIYKLDFKGMVNALAIGLNFKDILKYLEDNSLNDLPEKVKEQFDEWIKDSKKFKIKNITILDITDDDSFYEIVDNSDYKECIDYIRNKVIILNSKKIDKMKEKLNKNGNFWI